MENKDMDDEYKSKDYEKVEFTYSNDGVKTEPKIENSQKIYKFYGLDEKNVIALSNNCLFASHPYQLNDSFDSSDKIFDFTNTNEALFQDFYKIYLKEDYCNKKIHELYKIDRIQNFRELRETFVSSLSNKFGIISLTNNYKSLLMWSHYTSEKGFCIEFERDSLLSEYQILNEDINNVIFRPVQYVKEIQLLKISKWNFESFTTPFLYLSTVKNKEWKYENEFRLNIYKKDMDVPFDRKYRNILSHKGVNDRFFRYKKSTIKSIILGQNFFINENVEINNNNILEIKITEESNILENFIDLLFTNYNDKIYIMGEKQENGLLQKDFQKIYFERIKLNIFKICFDTDKN